MTRYILDIPDKYVQDKANGDARLLEKLIKEVINCEEASVFMVGEIQLQSSTGHNRASINARYKHYISDGKLNGTSSEPIQPSHKALEGDNPYYNLLGSDRGYSPPLSSHRPCLDIDIPVAVLPSKTPGHSHLFFPETSVTWKQYEGLLTNLRECNIIEDGYLHFALERKQTFVRAFPTPTGFKKNLPPKHWPANLRIGEDLDAPPFP